MTRRVRNAQLLHLLVRHRSQCAPIHERLHVATPGRQQSKRTMANAPDHRACIFRLQKQSAQFGRLFKVKGCAPSAGKEDGVILRAIHLPDRLCRAYLLAQILVHEKTVIVF